MNAAAAAAMGTRAGAANAGGAVGGGAGLPQSGAEYMASLRDGREVHIDGARVEDVTAHPGLRNAVRSIARLYDSLHDPAQRERLTCATDTGSGGLTHRYFRVSRSREELMAARGAIEGWARMSYGWMGRTPDYKASLTNTLGAAPRWYGPFEGSARAWYARAQERAPFISHAVVNPPVDRHLAPDAAKDVCVRVVRETDAGIVVSGAKVVATSAAISQWLFVGQTPATVGEDAAMAVSFLTPMGAPGMRVVCRTSYEGAARRHGSPFDYPLSARFDENDAIVVLENVVVPWENVLIYRDPARCRGFFGETGFLSGFLLHGCTRLTVKLEFMAGLLARALEATGGDEARGNRALLGEVVAWAETFGGLADAMVSLPDAWPGAEAGPDGREAVMPQRRAALAYCVLGPECWPRVREIVQRTVGSGLVYLPSSALDLADGETGPLLARCARGSHGMGHAERIKIMRLLWDAVGSEFAGRHELYERNYAGSWEGIRLQAAAEAGRSGRLAAMKALAERCMSEYDEGGWRGTTWG